MSKLGHKVYAVVNYTNAEIDPEVFEIYSETIKELADRCYLDVTRYGTSGFLRMKLGNALSERGLAPHIYESAEEAAVHVRNDKTSGKS